jgi:hypothetical protein
MQVFRRRKPRIDLRMTDMCAVQESPTTAQTDVHSGTHVPSEVAVNDNLNPMPMYLARAVLGLTCCDSTTNPMTHIDAPTPIPAVICILPAVDSINIIITEDALYRARLVNAVQYYMWAAGICGAFNCRSCYCCMSSLNLDIHQLRQTMIHSDGIICFCSTCEYRAINALVVHPARDSLTNSSQYSWMCAASVVTVVGRVQQLFYPSVAEVRQMVCRNFD